MIGAVALAACVVCVSANLIIYPHPAGVQPSHKFQVSVSQGGHKQSSFVYVSTSDARSHEQHYVKPGRSVSWTSFAFSGQPVTVEVTAPRDFHECKVRPRSYGIQCHRSGPKTAQFTVKSSNQFMSVEFDYDYGSQTDEITDKMLVFADHPETNVPNQHAPGVLYFGPGVHDLNGQKHLDGSIKEVYLAPGSYVHGGFITTGNHAVKIHGRGILSTEKYKFHDPGFKWAMINLDQGDHHITEGITMANPEEFYYRGLSGNNVVRGVKMVGAWTYNSDGVGIGHDGLVEDCFILANDDSLKVTSDKVTMQRIVVWQMENGAVFQTGWWSGRDMQTVRISDIDVIHLDWCVGKGTNCQISQNNAVFDLAQGTKTFQVSDIEFKDVRVEGSCPRLIYFKMESGAHGTVTNVRFINWHVDSQPTHDSLHNEISGTAAGHETNWHFQNLQIGGQCVSSPGQGDFLVDAQSTQHITFTCGNTHPVG